MALLLSCQNLAKSYSHRPLFTGITLGIYEAERIGLIGPNGSGKTTFLRLLAGVEEPDAGAFTRRRDLRLGYVPQEDTFPADATPVSVLTASLLERGDHRLDDTDRQTQSAIMLTRVGFTDPMIPVSALSGGWKKRLAIARELIVNPELLLMDEPTNHLDLEGILWLEKLLSAAKFACLAVSHDRWFLENMTTRIIEINRTYADGFFSMEGQYSDFLERREDVLAGQARQQESLANHVRQEIIWLKRGPKARRGKSKSRIDDAHEAIAELSDLKARNTAYGAAVDIEFSATQRKTNKLLVAHNLAKSLGGKPLFSGLNLILTPGMRVGLLGPNGSGKTTLLRTLNGDLPPDTGNVKRAPDLRVVYFDQARQQVERSTTLRYALAGTSDQVIYQNRPLHVSAWAKRFLFRYEQLDLPVSTLSGGEQARILIAQLMLRPADILILDEPTNDLDIPSLEVLEESLGEFPGAILLVTHDRFMLERLSTELLALDGQGHANTYTDFEQWERAQEPRRVAAVAPGKDRPRAEETPAPKRKKLTWAEERELEKIEDQVLAAEEQVTRLHHEMDATLTNPRQLDLVCQKLHEAQQTVQTLYARWQELESKKNA